MKRFDKIWVVAWVLFWLSLVATFLIDSLGLFETNNSGFIETIWISWIMWTIGLGLTLAVLSHVIIKE